MATYSEAHDAMKAIVGLRPAVMRSLSVQQDGTDYHLLLEVAPEYVSHKYPTFVNEVELRVRMSTSKEIGYEHE